jgi:cytochrome c biogenesis protein CcdA
LVLGGAAQRHRAAPLAMAAGMTISFAVLGVIIGLFGDALGLNPENVRTFAASMLIAFGFVMVVPLLNQGFVKMISPLANSANQASVSLNTASLKGAFLLGGLLGLIWSPCSGPLLGTALSLVATEGGAANGALTLGLFGAGAAIPLVVVAYISRAGFRRIQSWVVMHADQGKKVFGIVLLLVGLAILSGTDHWLESRINDWLPDGWLALTVRL